MPLVFHHVGVGTRTFEDTVAAYTGLGYTVTRQADDPGIGVRVALLASDAAGGPIVEVVAPLGESSPLDSLIRRGVLPTPYHTCYAVEDLDEAAGWLRERDFLPIGEPVHAVAFDGARVQFFMHRAVGLLELVERPPA